MTKYKLPEFDIPKSPDLDDCYDISDDDGDTTCYIGVEKNAGGQSWLWLTVDCDSCHDMTSPMVDVGPFESYVDAVKAGLDAACDILKGNYPDATKDLEEQIDAIMDAAHMDDVLSGSLGRL